MDYEQGLAMARTMKAADDRIKGAIRQVMSEEYGVVALKFSDRGTKMTIEILDEEFDPNVRVYPGE